MQYVPTDQEILNAYRIALLEVSHGKSYSAFGRSLTRADIADIQNIILIYEERLAQSAGYTNTAYAVMH
jgi:hypothetical protein